MATGDIRMQEKKGPLRLGRAELPDDARYSGEGKEFGRGDGEFTPSLRCLWDNQVELSGGQLKHWLEREIRGQS